MVLQFGHSLLTFSSLVVFGYVVWSPTGLLHLELLTSKLHVSYIQMLYHFVLKCVHVRLFLLISALLHLRCVESGNELNLCSDYSTELRKIDKLAIKINSFFFSFFKEQL
jgi:predicted subunit of tRNA(5-methylaminomethyl-2-thiouridylate) methyltransferase